MKHMHPSCGVRVAPTAIEWPALPFVCPKCGGEFTDYSAIVASVANPETPENVRRATFRCVLCDLFTFSLN